MERRAESERRKPVRYNWFNRLTPYDLRVFRFLLAERRTLHAERSLGSLDILYTNYDMRSFMFCLCPSVVSVISPVILF